MSIYVGDTGVSLELDVVEGNTPVDLSSAQECEMHLRDPFGIVIKHPAEIVMNRLRYVSGAADFTVHGVWEIRGYCALGGWRGHTSALLLDVSAARCL